MKPTDPPSPKASAGQASAGHDRDADGIVHHHSPEEMHNDDVAHEESDIDIRALVLSAVGMAVVVGMTAVLMWGLFGFLEEQAKANDPVLSPLAVPATAMPTTTTASPYFGGAPSPKLMTNEPGMLEQVREAEQQLLHGYGWVDEKAGIARMPIDEAKKLILQRGLPVRAPSVTDPRLGTHAPSFGESSSGRRITGGH
jgi:hypothetical protein